MVATRQDGWLLVWALRYLTLLDLHMSGLPLLFI
jgi:hypothetical protein